MNKNICSQMWIPQISEISSLSLWENCYYAVGAVLSSSFLETGSHIAQAGLELWSSVITGMYHWAGSIVSFFTWTQWTFFWWPVLEASNRQPGFPTEWRVVLLGALQSHWVHLDWARLDEVAFPSTTLNVWENIAWATEDTQIPTDLDSELSAPYRT